MGTRISKLRKVAVSANQQADAELNDDDDEGIYQDRISILRQTAPTPSTATAAAAALVIRNSNVVPSTSQRSRAEKQKPKPSQKSSRANNTGNDNSDACIYGSLPGGSKQIVINIQLLKVENERGDASSAALSGCSVLTRNANLATATATATTTAPIAATLSPSPSPSPSSSQAPPLACMSHSLPNFVAQAADNTNGDDNDNGDGVEELPEYCEVLEQAAVEAMPTSGEYRDELLASASTTATAMQGGSNGASTSRKSTEKTKSRGFFRELCNCVTMPVFKQKLLLTESGANERNERRSQTPIQILQEFRDFNVPVLPNSIQNVVMHIHIPPHDFATCKAARLANSRTEYTHHLVPQLDKIYNASYYWGNIDRQQADRLMQGKPDGTFLLRDSSQEEYAFSVTYKKYNLLLHARIEHAGHRFSFDCHDPDFKKTDTITDLMDHYKEPNPGGVMFFEPVLKIPLHRPNPFSLQDICRAKIASNTTYNDVNQLDLPTHLKKYIRNYHYKIKLRSKEIYEPYYV